MSPETPRQRPEQLPRTTLRAFVAAVALCIAGLAIHQPLILGAALTGAFLGVGTVGLTGSTGRTLFAATLAPVGFVTAVALVGALLVGDVAIPLVGFAVEASAYGALAAAVVTVLAMGVVWTVTGGLTEDALSRASTNALAGAIVGAGLSLVGYQLATSRSGDGVLETAAFLAGPGAGGVVVTVLLAGLSLVLAAFALPAAAVTTPHRPDRLSVYRHRAVALVALGTGLLVSVVVLAEFVGLGQLVSAVFDTLGFRLGLVGVAVLGTLVVGTSLFARWSWDRTETGNDPHVAILLGTVVGLTAIIGSAFALGVPPELSFLVPALLAAASVGLFGLQWLFGVAGVGSSRRALPTTLGLACVAGAIAAGADLGDTTTLGWSEFGVAVALGAGLFAYSIGRYASDLSNEVSTLGARREPQLVHVAYAGLVVALGVVVAIGGFWAAMAVAPSFSAPAIIALASAMLAIALVVRALRDSGVTAR